MGIGCDFLENVKIALASDAGIRYTIRRFHHGDIAQLVERLNGIEKVRGSTPLISTIKEAAIQPLLFVFGRHTCPVPCGTKRGGSQFTATATRMAAFPVSLKRMFYILPHIVKEGGCMVMSSGKVSPSRASGESQSILFFPSATPGACFSRRTCHRRYDGAYIYTDRSGKCTS